jgi:hypothetical protein
MADLQDSGSIAENGDFSNTDHPQIEPKSELDVFLKNPV